MELTKGEIKSLAREKSYRNGRFGAIFLAIVSFLVFGMMLATSSQHQGPDTGMMSVVGWFWLALAYAADLQIKRCATIKRLQEAIALTHDEPHVSETTLQHGHLNSRE